MAVIDADTHVIETSDTWDFLEGNDKRYRPVAVTSEDGKNTPYWLVDGHIIDREIGDETIPLDVRTLRDLKGRKEIMAKTGFDVQVLYPTFFTARPDKDLPRLLAGGCGDNLMIGTDFGHADASTELATLNNLEARGQIDAAFHRKLVTDNPARLYGI